MGVGSRPYVTLGEAVWGGEMLEHIYTPGGQAVVVAAAVVAGWGMLRKREGARSGGTGCGRGGEGCGHSTERSCTRLGAGRRSAFLPRAT